MYIIFSSHVSIKNANINDACGVRTHALSEWRLEPPPWTARPKRASKLSRGFENTSLDSESRVLTNNI